MKATLSCNRFSPKKSSRWCCEKRWCRWCREKPLCRPLQSLCWCSFDTIAVVAEEGVFGEREGFVWAQLRRTMSCKLLWRYSRSECILSRLSDYEVPSLADRRKEGKGQTKSNDWREAALYIIRVKGVKKQKKIPCKVQGKIDDAGCSRKNSHTNLWDVDTMLHSARCFVSKKPTYKQVQCVASRNANCERREKHSDNDHDE